VTVVVVEVVVVAAEVLAIPIEEAVVEDLEVAEVEATVVVLEAVEVAVAAMVPQNLLAEKVTGRVRTPVVEILILVGELNVIDAECHVQMMAMDLEAIVDLTEEEHHVDVEVLEEIEVVVASEVGEVEAATEVVVSEVAEEETEEVVVAVEVDQ